jgi:alkylated DNA nucleotide flippase Atl1
MIVTRRPGWQLRRRQVLSWRRIVTGAGFMAKGYPSRKRTRKAFERGVKTAKTGKGFNPYRNPVLKELFERGRGRGGLGGSAGGSGGKATPRGNVTPGGPTAARPADASDAAWHRAVRASQRRRI